MLHLKNIHPGEILKEEFLIPNNFSINLLADSIAVSENTISDIINGNSSITETIAHRLGNHFGNSTNFWLGLQHDFDSAK